MDFDPPKRRMAYIDGTLRLKITGRYGSLAGEQAENGD
jgi:hypothetical protein